jgi:hypothetical protein
MTMMKNGQIGTEAFERTIEAVTVTANVGVAMGYEVYTPTLASELGRPIQ